MGFAGINDERRFQTCRENYRRAFGLFTLATEEFLRFEETEDVNSSQLRDANVRMRDAQNTCREARDRLARFLLARQRERMANHVVPPPARLERLIFLSQVESLLVNDRKFEVVYAPKRLEARPAGLP